MSTKRSVSILWLGVLLAWSASVSADVDLPTKFTNQGGIANTRHNLTQSTIGGGATAMNPFRNDYGEVCVYCHTPHGANTQVKLPLWNRTVRTNTYTTYDSLGTSTLTQTVGQPGANSISCLTCHDGTTAVDSIINMPGSGKYSAAQETTQNNAFLNNSWNNTSGADATQHLALNGANEAAGCLACHSSDSLIVGAGATDFKIFAIGTDLRNDHPVGITFPTGNPDFNPTNGTTARGDKFFDLNTNGRMDPKDVRLYETGEGPEVECASCHDPHGVPSGAAGSVFNPTFLRVSNANSALCLTCHIK